MGRETRAVIRYDAGGNPVRPSRGKGRRSREAER